MRVRRSLWAGLGLLLVSGTISLAGAVPAQAASICELTVKDTQGPFGDEVQALELQEKGGDEIFMRLNGTEFPGSGSVSFTFAGQGRPASAFGNPRKSFTGSIRVQLIEDDTLFNDEIGDVFLPCEPVSGTLQLINDGPGAYNIEIEIRRL